MYKIFFIYIVLSDISIFLWQKKRKGKNSSQKQKYKENKNIK
jgi:hypothetical protein